LELLAVLLALLVLSAPVLAVSAVVRQRKLRLQIEELAQRTSQQNDALHREMLELRRQIAAVNTETNASATSQDLPTVHVEIPQPSPPVAAPVARTPDAVPIVPTFSAPATPAKETPRAEPVSPPSIPVNVEVRVQPSEHPQIEAIIANASEKVVEPAKVEATEVASNSPHSPSTGVSPLPSAVPASPITPTDSAKPPASTSASSTPTPVSTPSSAWGTEAPQFATLRSASAKASAQQRMKSVFALEETLGTNWLNKLGITILVLGLALFGIYELGQLGPAGKVGLSFFVSFALLAGGVFFEKRERYRVLGHTLIGGGWALLFFTTYALNHVQAMHVLDSENIDLVLMLGAAIAMVAHTLRYCSQLVTGLAFLLAYTTVSLSHDTVYSLASGVILAIGLVSIVLKMEWFELEVFGIVAAYLDHLYWLYRLLGPHGAQGQAFPEYRGSTALLLFYWVIFRLSYILRKPKSPRAEHISTMAALVNTLLLLGTMKFQSVHPELAFLALLAMGAVEFTCGQLPITRRRREAFVVLTTLGAALMITAVPFRYSGNNVAILWLIGAEALLIAGVVVSEIVFRRLALLTGYLVALHLVRIDFMQLVATRRAGEEMLLTAGVIFGLCAVIFYVNSLYVGERWKTAFFASPDSELLCGHSYIGAFAAVSSIWALCSHDWTAVAFAAVMFTLAGLGRKLKSFHLQVQYGAIGAITLYRVVVVNLHSDAPAPSHIAMRLVTLPVIAAFFYVTAKWAQFSDDSNQRAFRGLLAVAGSALLTALIYYEVPELWQPVAAIVFAIALVEVGRWAKYYALVWHAHALGILAILAALTADQAGTQRWHSIPLHAFGALPVVAGLYWIAKRITVPNPEHVESARFAHSWAGSGLMLWVLNEAVPVEWKAVSWIAFAIILALVARRIYYKQLTWQANVVAGCAVARTYASNFNLEETVWPGTSFRLLTVTIVAAGLYFLSRKAVVSDSPSGRTITYLHTVAATALLALLAWYEAPGAWLASVWALFALALALVDHHFELPDLGWQAHGLALLTLFRSVSVNLYANELWHGISVRLLSLTVVAIVMYALATITRRPEGWRKRDLNHFYSWAASTLVSLLMWYELRPLSVAVGWAVFGLVLFEYGLLRKIRQFRFQSYVALTAAFARIFFANLAAGNPGEFWGPRIYTVLPLTLILFFVYTQLDANEAEVGQDRRLHFNDLFGYLGTGSVVAMLYFQFPNDWLATAWAGTVFVLFGIALLLNRSIFLYQAILLTTVTCVRGIMHNLFGASYFSGGDWTGRYLVLGLAIAILLACLPFAFRLRDRHKEISPPRWFGILVRHPEQFMFFAPVLLLTLMLALKMRAGMVTVAWGVEAVMIILLALAVNERTYRLTGLVLLLICVGKIMVRDAWGLAPRDRYITFIILGAALLLVSFLYSKYREAIRQFL
jgi:hypothetical protein